MEKNRLRELRKLKKVTQSEIAEKLGVSQAQVARIEAGINDINTEQMRKLAEILQVKPYELLPLEEQPDVLSDEEKEILQMIRKSSHSNRANNNNPPPQTEAKADITKQTQSPKER
ncbi:MAG: helix-turn-helix transcriptional regulator [Alphaproteobacteria bacterium]|nr:helix-turn-helix transcriptional regulator [Alphaproteobacteria bacterium]